MPHHYQRNFFEKIKQIVANDKVEIVGGGCGVLGSVIGFKNAAKYL